MTSDWSLKGKEFKVIINKQNHTKRKVIGISEENNLVFDREPEETKDERVYYKKEDIEILREKLISAFMEKAKQKDKKGMKTYNEDDILIELHVFEMKEIINNLFGVE